MASGIMPAQPGDQSHRGHPSSGSPTRGATPNSGWVPLALALTALAGMTAIGVLGGGQRDRRQADGKRQGGGLSSEPEVERSITIGKAADELYQRWRDPKTLSQIMAGFAAVHATDNGRTHWKVEGPLGRAYEWDSETVDDHPDAGIGWRTLPGAAVSNEGSIRFRRAPADRGTIATLRFRFDPPDGALGDAAIELLGTTPLDVVADGVLRRFKSLVEAGEIPTTERQPAARADTR